MFAANDIADSLRNGHFWAFYAPQELATVLNGECLTGLENFGFVGIIDELR